jgi:hypothetical protein
MYFNTNSNSSYSLYVSAYIDGADIPGLQSVETTIPGIPMLLSVRSLDDLEQGSADRQSMSSVIIILSWCRPGTHTNTHVQLDEALLASGTQNTLTHETAS